MMTMKIEIVPEKTSLTIGDEYAKENTISFRIQVTGEGPVLLRLQIPVGADGVLFQDEDANNMRFSEPDNPDQMPRQVSVASPNTKAWSFGNGSAGIVVNGSLTLSVKIHNILCRANAGESKIEVTGMSRKAGPKSTATLTVTKGKPTTWKNPILYFIAEPNFLISGEEVNLRWEVADTPGKVSLDFRGDSISDPNSGMAYKPKKEGIFTLRLDNSTNTQSVDMLSKNNWYEADPRLGESLFPAVLFDSGDQSKNALYVIFMLLSQGDETQTVRTPVLCQSANGVTGWKKCDSSDVPFDMASSPGVRVKNRLYLIGGSSVDWDQKSRTISYYDLDNPSKNWQEAEVSFTGMAGEAADFEERMGHACAIVGEKIWVMGGSGRYGSLNDVWELTVDDRDKSTPIKIEAKQIEPSVSASASGWGRKWAPRCMFSAVHYNNEIWVCGGVDSPQGNPLGGIYYREVDSKDKAWKLKPDIDQTRVVKDAIGTGVARCGDKLFVLTTQSTALAADVHATLVYKLTHSTTTKDDWDQIQKTPDRPTDWTISNHSITLVGFQNRVYLRYLYRDPMRRGSVKEPLGALYLYID
jgi:hypothetical protein